MRRLALILLAGLLALGMSAGVGKLTAKPVHAVGGACYFSDQDGVVYPDGYFHDFQAVQDVGTGATHQVGFDLQAYRYAPGVNNECMRAYYVSVWVDDRTIANSLTAHMRIWICGQPAADMQQVAYNDWGRAVVSYWQNVVWGTWPPAGFDWRELNVNTPDGHTWALDFVDYQPCGRQADNWISQANGYWNPNTAFRWVQVNG